MAKVSFNRTAAATPPPVGDTATASTAVATPGETNTGMAVAAPASPDDNSWKRQVMAKPYLSIGARTGDLTAEHPEWIGKLVYDKAVGMDSARVIVVGMKHGYEEDREYGSDGFPERWATEAAAKASGLPFYDTVQLDLLLECAPDSDLAQFSMLEVDGKCYVPALFGTKRKTMSRTAGVIVRDEMGWLKGDTASGFYTLKAELDKGAQNPYYYAFVKADGKVSDALRAEIRAKFGV